MSRRSTLTALLAACLLAGCASPQVPTFAVAAASQHLQPISGRVNLPVGMLPSALTILVYPQDARPGDQPRVGTVDAQGRFQVDVPEGQAYNVLVQQADQRYSALQRHVLAGTSLDVDLVPTGTVSGTLTLTGTATAAAGVWVYVPGTSFVAITDANGAYTFGNLPVGAQTLAATGPGYTPKALGSVTVAAATTTTVAAATIDAATGTNGASFRSGSGVPSAGLGVDGDSYVDVATADTYTKASGAWTYTGSLRGPAPTIINMAPTISSVATNALVSLGSPGSVTMGANDTGIVVRGVATFSYTNATAGNYMLILRLRAVADQIWWQVTLPNSAGSRTLTIPFFYTYTKADVGTTPTLTFQLINAFESAGAFPATSCKIAGEIVKY